MYVKLLELKSSVEDKVNKVTSIIFKGEICEKLEENMKHEKQLQIIMQNSYMHL